MEEDTLKRSVSTPRPQEVVIASDEQAPVPVIIEAEKVKPKPRPNTVTAGEGTVLAPDTTEEEQAVTAGQRRINVLWEVVQGLIAIFTTFTTVYVLAAMTLSKNDVTANQLIAVGQLVVMATLILSFYFSRTNHTAIGGTGKKPNEPYKGR